jgi:FkbM family methyltransferase
LEKNISEFNNIVIFNQYLGEKKANLQVTMEKDGWNNTIVPNKKGDKSIELITLDELLFQNKIEIENIKLLKIDTEGFDTIILRGALETIKKSNPVIYFEYNGENMKNIGENGIETLLSLKEFGYDRIHIYDCINNLILVTGIGDEGLLKQLDSYAGREKSMIPYYDVCIFHKNDADLSKSFENIENKI